MRYMGNKAKLAARILSIVLRDRRPDQWYVEPFAGGMNMICRVGGPRIGNDSHGPLVAMWKAVQEGWQPPTIVTKQMYYWVKERQESLPQHLVGFVGFLCSFGGKWWGGYAFDAVTGRNYAAEGCRAIDKQRAGIRGVRFESVSYDALRLPKGSVVYCDPPYAETTEYENRFNYVEFWKWVRRISATGHTVFVSEYAAPSDFECVLEIPYTSTMNRSKKDPKTERLFRLRGNNVA